MRQFIFKGVGVVLGLILVAIALAVVLTSGDPNERALALLKQQGYTVEAIQMLSDRLVWASGEEAEGLYDELRELVARVLSNPKVTAANKEKIKRIRDHAAIKIGKARGERALREGDFLLAYRAFSEMEEGIEGLGEPIETYRDLLSVDYYQQRAQTLRVVESAAELEKRFSRLFGWAIALSKTAEELDARLTALGEVGALGESPDTHRELAAVACQQAGLIAYLLGNREKAQRWIAQEGEWLLRPPGPSPQDFTHIVQLPNNLTGDLAERVLYWKLGRAHQLGELASREGYYAVALEAYRQMEAEAERSGKPLAALASYFNPDYFKERVEALITVARLQDSGITARQLESELVHLFDLALQVTEASTLTPDLKGRLERVFTVLDAHVSELAVAEIRSVILKELAFLAFVLGNGQASIGFTSQWVELQDKLAELEGVYTLQELAKHPEIAEFSVQGNGTFTSMDLVFTRVSRRIVVLVRPVVFRYVGVGRYQNMVVYRIQLIEVSQPMRITIPALCLDYTAKIPAKGLRDYEIVEIADYTSQGQVDYQPLMRLLFTLQFIEEIRERLRGSGLHGAWDILLEFPLKYWERLRADLVWNFTNPDAWETIKKDLIVLLQVEKMTDYLAGRLPLPSEWSSEDRRAVAEEVARLLAEGGEEWQSILDMLITLANRILPRWTTPDELKRALLLVLEDESIPEEIRQGLTRYLQLVFWGILEQKGYRTPLSDIRSYLNRHLKGLLETLEQFRVESERQVDAILNFLQGYFELHLKGA